MSTTTPLVTVLMSVYNSEKHLREALDSVLRQDFENFEFLIINDGSSDKSADIIEAYAKHDSRIRLISQPNHGLVYSLNRGIEAAKGHYIARMDSDDIWMDNHLSDLVKYVIDHKGTVLVGGGFEIIDQNGCFMDLICPPTRDVDLRRTMYLRNPFGHAAVMYLREAALKVGCYSNDVGPTEDYDLWLKLKNVGAIGSLPRPIFRYRINLDGISSTSGGKQSYYTQLHIDHSWRTGVPQVMSRQELLMQGKQYLREADRLLYGLGLKHQFLSDNAQLGVKLIRNRHYIDGIKQLIFVASTGRQGLKIVTKRIKLILSNTVRNTLHPNKQGFEDQSIDDLAKILDSQ